MMMPDQQQEVQASAMLGNSCSGIRPLPGEEELSVWPHVKLTGLTWIDNKSEASSPRSHALNLMPLLAPVFMEFFGNSASLDLMH